MTNTHAARAIACLSLVVPLCACTVTSVSSQAHAPMLTPHVERTTGDVKLSDASLAASALQSGDLSLASTLFSKTLEKHPDDVDALIGMGTTLAESGDFEHARESYRHAAAIAPKRMEPILELARLDLRQRRLDEAIALYKLALSREPSNRFASAGLGTAYAVKGDEQAAKETFSKALEAYPHDVMLTIDLGLLYVLDGQVRKGANLLLDVAGQPGTPVQARQNLALAYGLLGNYDAADEVLMRDLPRKTAEDNVAFYKIVRAKLESLPNGAEIATLPSAKAIDVAPTALPMPESQLPAGPVPKSPPLETPLPGRGESAVPAAQRHDALLTPQAAGRRAKVAYAAEPPAVVPAAMPAARSWTMRHQTLLDPK